MVALFTLLSCAYCVSSALSPHSAFSFSEWMVSCFTGEKGLLLWCTVWPDWHVYESWSVCVTVMAAIPLTNVDLHSYNSLSSEGK